MLRRFKLFLRVVLIGLCAAEGAHAAGSEPAQNQAAQAWLGLIAGPAAASETMLAADMASLFPHSEQLARAPMLGDTGAGNLALLLDDPHVDLAFVSTDALAGEAAKDKALSRKTRAGRQALRRKRFTSSPAPISAAWPSSPAGR